MTSFAGETTCPASVCGEAAGAGQQLRRSPARALVEAIKTGDALQQRRILARPDLPRIAATLAEWVAGRRPLEPCGTRSAAERHIANGEPLDDACLAARRKFYRERQRERRSAAQRDRAIDPKANDVRAWAIRNGHQLGSRGPLPEDIIAAYRAAMGKVDVA